MTDWVNILGNAGPQVILSAICVVLALANRRQYRDNKAMTDRYISKHDKLAEMQQETLRMWSTATLVVKEATQAIAALRAELEDK